MSAPPANDAPSLGKILRLAIRTLPYLGAVRRDLLRLAAVLAPIALLAIPIGMLGQDLLLNRVLGGKPLTPTEAHLLLLDPSVFVDVETLGLEARQLLRTRLVLYTVGIVLVAVPVGLRITAYFIALAQRINQTLRVSMMEQVQAMSLRYHSGTKVGDSIYRAYQDSAMVTNLMAMLVAPILPLLGATFGVLLAFLFDWRLTVLLGLMYVCSVLLGRWFGARLRVDFRRARELNSDLTSRIQETMNGIKVVKAYGAEGLEQRRFEDASERAFAGAFQARTHLALFGIVSFCLTAVPALTAACLLAVFAAEERAITASALLAFTGFAAWNLGAYSYAMGRVTTGVGSTRALLRQWGMTQDMTVGMERAFQQVDLKPEVQDADDAIEFPGLEREVSFKNVSFAYQPERPVLTDVTLTARAGTITALVGPTGSGKSTLVTLLLRLFDPDGGHIEVDGTDLRRFTLDSVRRSIGIALQENLLFGTTIRENIRYAVPEATDEQVREAARIACADDFIEQQPEGYDTPLGERGTKLSTGQRQRLSIARAVIKDTPILVLDEPTASLDADTELRVLQNLSQWGQGRAIFLITHRLSTIRKADHIVYLQNGGVREEGSHDELMAREGSAYRRFVELEEGHDEAGEAAQ